MSKLDDFKLEYENIKAPENLIIKANKEIKKSKFKTVFKTGIGLSAGFVFAIGIAANASPTFANAVSEIPGLEGFVKVVTFGKYQRVDNGYEISVETPKIEGLVDQNIQDKLNEEFNEQADKVIELFEKDVKELKEKFGDEQVHMGIEYNYDVKTNNDDILALDAYIWQASGSSSVDHNFYTINKHTGEVYTLEGMFKEGTNYITPINKYIVDEMRRLNKEEGALFFIDDETFGEFEGIKADQDFYINNDGDIVICFDKYEIAAGAQGSPEFAIPNDVIKDIVK